MLNPFSKSLLISFLNFSISEFIGSSHKKSTYSERTESTKDTIHKIKTSKC